MVWSQHLVFRVGCTVFEVETNRSCSLRPPAPLPPALTPTVPALAAQTLDTTRYTPHTLTAASNATTLAQLGELTKRAMLNNWRDQHYNVVRLFLCTVVHVFLGAVFRDIDRKDFAGIQVRSPSLRRPCCWNAVGPAQLCPA
jgi:hypothetical protein